MSQASAEFIPTRIAILTVSSRRGEEDDTSGHWLREAAQEAGHHVVDKAIVKENRYAIRAQVSAWIASDDVQVVLITGGTGFTEGDQAPEALLPLFDREVEGFGEVFHTQRNYRKSKYAGPQADQLSQCITGFPDFSFKMSDWNAGNILCAAHKQSQQIRVGALILDCIISYKFPN